MFEVHFDFSIDFDLSRKPVMKIRCIKTLGKWARLVINLEVVWKRQKFEFEFGSNSFTFCYPVIIAELDDCHCGGGPE